MQLSQIALSLFATAAAASEVVDFSKEAVQMEVNDMDNCPVAETKSAEYFLNPINPVCGYGCYTKLILEQVDNAVDAQAKCDTLNTRFGGTWVLATPPTSVPQYQEQQRVLKKCLGCKSYAQAWLSNNFYYANTHCNGRWQAMEIPAGANPVNRFVMCQISNYPQPIFSGCGYYKKAQSQ